ncbi:MAG: hypothetical protein AAGK37_14410 [Pseudomonadota bacterium]
MASDRRDDVAQVDVHALKAAFLGLGPGIDPQEALRAARIAYEYAAILKAEYQIEDPPLIHNAKVNFGAKPRGLCWHWAEDIERRLQAEAFETLEVHRAITNATNLRIEHSTAIISPKGGWIYDGIVLDPWRYGGVLFWSATRDDPNYDWYPQVQVFAAKRRARGFFRD